MLAEPCFSNNLSTRKGSVDSWGHDHKGTAFKEWKGFFFLLFPFFNIAGGLFFSSQVTYFMMTV